MSGRRAHAEIVGFEFLIEPRDGAPRWTRLQGSGGNLGAGCLYAVRDLSPRSGRVRETCERLIAIARAELDREGFVRTWTNHDDHTRRIASVPARAVLDCRPIRVQV